VNAETLEKYFDLLWPICRSITGKGFVDSLDILSELIPLEKHYWKSGEKVNDWIVPKEWNIKGASIWREHGGKTVIDFKNNNLHIVGYSEPRAGLLPWKLLREHVYTIPELPDAIPYITSFYKRSWGFCMPHNQYLELEKDPEARYFFNIDSTLQNGQLVAGDLVVPGEVEDEIFLTSYLCHPSLANNELSGPLVLAGVYDRLKDLKLKHTLRFYVGPENIGAVAYLSRFGETLKRNVVAGLVVNCVGLGPEYTYKKSRCLSSLNFAAKNVLEHKPYRKVHSVFSEKPHRFGLEIMDYFPDGSDERQFCSPGYNLPIGVFMRRGYWAYKEYHTSLDNKELISFDTIMESIDTVVDIVLTIDKNAYYKSTVQYGTPMFAKCPEDIYDSTMKLNNFYKGEGYR
jgi:aminopeptidase-like protein